MHTGHIVLIEADSAEEAVAEVEMKLMPDEGRSWAEWSDWCEIGGRWEGEFGEGEPSVLQYSDDPILADTKINKFLQNRLDYLQSAITAIESFDLIGELKKYNPETSSIVGDTDDWMSKWKARTALEIVEDHWVAYSGVYDITYGSATLGEFRKRCESDPDRQFLVMVDFHY